MGASLLIDDQIRDELLSQLDNLPVARQWDVLEFAKALANDRVVGKPGKELMPLVGVLSDDAAREMLTTIEQECERIDENEW